jgi:hypothetical protein
LGDGTRPELGDAIDLQGYVGKYPIRAMFDVVSGAAYGGHVGDSWSGSYRYTGKASDVRIEGRKADPDEPPDPYHPDEFACVFEERVGTPGRFFSAPWVACASSTRTIGRCFARREALVRARRTCASMEARPRGATVSS